jgi:hypothetical protein
LAPGGGLAVDGQGNAILYGTTDGAMFRNKAATSTSSDIFVLTMKQSDGSHAAPMSNSSTTDTATTTATPMSSSSTAAATTTAAAAAAIIASAVSSTIVADSQVDANSSMIETDGASSSEVEDASSSTATTTTQPFGGLAQVVLPVAVIWGDHKITFIVLIVVGGLVLMSCIFGFMIITFLRQQVKDKQRKQMKDVFYYLHGMDMEDIDIRRSPAGGFHVSYLNGLACGEKNKAMSSTSTSQTHTQSDLPNGEDEDEDEDYHRQHSPTNEGKSGGWD